VIGGYRQNWRPGRSKDLASFRTLSTNPEPFYSRGHRISILLTISGQRTTHLSGCGCTQKAVTASSRWRLFCLSLWSEKVMSAGRLPPELNLLTEFTMAIGGAFMIGLPMALAIIWLLQ
jgi:hypothetical protein